MASHATCCHSALTGACGCSSRSPSPFTGDVRAPGTRHKLEPCGAKNCSSKALTSTTFLIQQPRCTLSSSAWFFCSTNSRRACCFFTPRTLRRRCSAVGLCYVVHKLCSSGAGHVGLPATLPRPRLHHCKAAKLSTALREFWQLLRFQTSTKIFDTWRIATLNVPRGLQYFQMFDAVIM